jgi:putative transcriptional regulator
MTRKNKTLGDELLESMAEALDHTRGKKIATRVTSFDVPTVAVKQIRKKVGLNQDAFARALGVSPSGLRKWEQRQRQPRGAALTLLRVWMRNPRRFSRVAGRKQRQDAEEPGRVRLLLKR